METNHPEMEPLLARLKKMFIEALTEVVDSLRPSNVPGQFPPPAATEPSPAKRPRGENFETVRQYLIAMGGKPVTIPTISRATGIPQSSIRTLLYKTKREAFCSVFLPGSTERAWLLADPSAQVEQKRAA